MRIRKRLQSLTTAPDLSSPPPQSTAAAAAVPVVATGAAGGKQGEVVAGRGGEKLYGLGSGSGGGGAAGGGGRGLHPGMDLPAQTVHGCTTKPTSPPPSHPLPPDAAAPWGEERSDLAPRGSRFVDTGGVPFDHAAREREVPKQEQEGENGGDGDGRRRRNTVVFIGATVPAPKSCLGAEAPVPPRGHGGYHGVALAAASAKAEGMAGWAGDEARGFPIKKRRGCCRARGTRSVCGDDDDEEEHGSEEKSMVAAADQREVKPRAGNTRRRGVAASSYTTTIGATAGSTSTTARTNSAFNGSSSVGAPSSGGAAKKSDDVVPAKEEGAGDVVSSTATATALVGPSRGVGNGKKRRSPAVLMEGSRCSRVNGRGWRCCQQTLVGYSLCEHHLGKGRLRSVSSVRCNGRARKKEDVVDNGAAPSHLPSPLQQQPQSSMSTTGDVVEYYDVDEEEKPGKRRRKKIGMVKARSISSLLHLPNYSTPTAILAAPAPEPCPSPSPVPATGAVTACPATPAIV